MKAAAILGSSILLACSWLSAAQAQEKERTLEVILKVPSTAYKVKVEEVYQTDKELWVLSTVSGKGIGLTVISTAKDQVKVKAPDTLPVKHFVLGKSWGWGDEKYEFLKAREEFV